MNQWDKTEAQYCQDPGPLTDWEKKIEGCMTQPELSRTIVGLRRLAPHFAKGGECRRKVDDCIEVAEGLKDQWTRNAAGKP